MLGLERKSRVLSDEERRLVAYHEAGHALVGLTVPGADPLHKVTIIPRAGTRAHRVSAGEELHKYTKQSIESRLAMAYGGRVAEELVFGPEKVTTGAAQDIQQATNIARRMVTQFGMSAVIGPIAVGDREQEIFLAAKWCSAREISDRTAADRGRGSEEHPHARLQRGGEDRQRAPRGPRPSASALLSARRSSASK